LPRRSIGQRLRRKVEPYQRPAKIDHASNHAPRLDRHAGLAVQIRHFTVSGRREPFAPGGSWPLVPLLNHAQGLLE